MEGPVTLPPAGTTAATVTATLAHSGAASTVNVSMPPNFQFAVRVMGGGSLWPRVDASVLNHTAANCTEQVFLVLGSQTATSYVISPSPAQQRIARTLSLSTESSHVICPPPQSHALHVIFPHANGRMLKMNINDGWAFVVVDVAVDHGLVCARVCACE